MPDLTLLQTLHRWADKIAPRGAWCDGGTAGMWYVALHHARSNVYADVGFRPEDLAALVRDAEDAPGLRARVSRLERVLAEDVRVTGSCSHQKGRNMHYKNGRPAQNGDKVVYFGWGGPVVGILYDAVAGNDTCNGKLGPIAPNDPCPNLAECLHLDDVLGAIPHVEGKPEPGVTYGSPSEFLDLAIVPDSSLVKAE